MKVYLDIAEVPYIFASYFFFTPNESSNLLGQEEEKEEAIEHWEAMANSDCFWKLMESEQI